MSRGAPSELVEELELEVRRFITAVILFNQRVAEEVGLNATDMQALHLIQLSGEATPGELGRRSGLSSGGVTVVLDRLEKAGYVQRTPNPGDRRSLIVRPVAARLRKLEAIYRSKSGLLRKALSEYDPDQLGLLLDFFRKTNRLESSRPEPAARRSRARG
jgi:MarR family transcriptional regulator, organic hydroperoxide resistance regulator